MARNSSKFVEDILAIYEDKICLAITLEEQKMRSTDVCPF